MSECRSSREHRCSGTPWRTISFAAYSSPASASTRWVSRTVRGVANTGPRGAQQLAAIGLVETIPKRGAFVARIGLPQLVEMFEVMAELEGMCARLAARRITQPETEALRQSTRGLRSTPPSTAIRTPTITKTNASTTASTGRATTASWCSRHASSRRASSRTDASNSGSATASVGRWKSIARSWRPSCPAMNPGAEARIEQHVKIQGERFADFVASVGGMAA